MRGARITLAILEASGEQGYRGPAVQDVLNRYGGSRVQFYRQFSSKAKCFEAAYETEIEALSDRVLGADRDASSWSAGLRAALAELGNFLVERPALAVGLLVEVHVAAGPALARRTVIAERFTRRSTVPAASPTPSAPTSRRRH